MTITAPAVGDPVDDWFDDVTNELNTVSGLYSGAWTSYVPNTGSNVLQAATTDPTQGNTTYLAEFLRMHTGLIKVRVKLSIDTGGGWSAGSGAWRIMLPPQYPTMTANDSNIPSGNAWINDTGTALHWGIVIPDNSTTYVSVFQDGGSGVSVLGSSGPGTAWATGDVLSMKFEYEPA